MATSIAPSRTETFSVALPWRANMVGLSYAGSKDTADVAISARAHTSDGWSSWEELGSNDNGGDGFEAAHQSKRITTDPLWVGTADGLQIRVALGKKAHPLQDVHVQLLNTLGDSEPAGPILGALHAVGRFLMRQPYTQPAQAMTTQPAIITRAQWGADPSHLNLPCPGIASTLKMAFVHHTDTSNSYTKSGAAAQVRAIYLYHTDTRGYCDIAYNFLVDRYGQIFEGRNGGITNNVIGAHTGGYNTYTVGVALLGTFSSVKPTSAMLVSLQDLLAWRMDIAHIPAIGTVTMITGSGNDHTAAGTAVTFNRIAGHRDASYTSCPGAYAYADLPYIRTHVDGIGRPKIYLPGLSYAFVRPDGDGKNDTTRLSATFSQTVNWSVALVNRQGTTARTYTGSPGSTLSLPIDGTDGSAPLPTGVYTWRLSASDSSGHPARSAVGSLSIVSTHPDGTILKDGTGTYLIKGGKRLTVDPTAYTSNFGTTPAVTTGPDERARYADGGALGLREGTVLQVPGTTPTPKYVWTDGELRSMSDSVFTSLGYQTSALISASQTYLNALASGPAWTSTTAHPDGTLIHDPATGKLYVIQGGQLSPATDLASRASYRAAERVEAKTLDLAKTVGSAFPVREGALIKDPNGTAPWIMISDGMKHQFLSNAFFSYMGYTTAMLLSASSADFGAIPSGTSIPASTAPVNPAITGAAIQLPFQTSTSFVVGWTASDGGNG
ncbi:MAG: N-acetylmuramoyl-L-alanine amidase, partial [Actinomycetota bacterium]